MRQWLQSIGWIVSASDIEGSHQAIMEGMSTGCIPIFSGEYAKNADAIYPTKYWGTIEQWSDTQSRECHQFAKHFTIQTLYTQWNRLFFPEKLLIENKVYNNFENNNLENNNLENSDEYCYDVQDVNNIYFSYDTKYKNIDLFSNILRRYSKILLICNDYPGYGGAATNAYEMLTFFKKRNINVHGVFFTKDRSSMQNKDYDIIGRKELPHYLSNHINQYTAIVLRNWVEFDLRTYTQIPVFYCIAGIFKDLDRHYSELTNRDMLDKYISKAVLNTIRNSTMSFIASEHSQHILNTYYNLETHILHFNYIPYYNTYPMVDQNWNHRKYSHACIVSDFNRQIKNVGTSIEKMKYFNKHSILIGKDSDKFNLYQFNCTPLLNRNKVIDMMKDTKYIVQDSYYESCSNVVVESIFNGCHLYRLMKLGICIHHSHISLFELTCITRLIQLGYTITILSNINIDNLPVNCTYMNTNIDNMDLNCEFKYILFYPYYFDNVLDKVGIYMCNDKIIAVGLDSDDIIVYIRKHQLTLQNISECPYLHKIYVEGYNTKMEEYPIRNTLHGTQVYNAFPKNAKILFTSTQFNGYGGAATNIYNLHKYLISMGFHSCAVFFHNKAKSYEEYNSDHIPNVLFVHVKGSDYSHTPNNIVNYGIREKVIQCLGSEPTLILSKNYRSPLYANILFPNIYHIYMVSGINQFNKISLQNYKTIMNDLVDIPDEIKTVGFVDKIIVNSQLTHRTFNQIYHTPKLHNHVINTSNCLFRQEIYQNCDDKTIDIIVVCSNLDRAVKNNRFLLTFLKDDRLAKYSKLIIGINYDDFNQIENTTCIGLVDNKTVHSYFAKSKCLLFPSLFESSSNTVKEAVLYKNIALLTNCVGYSERFPDYCICSDFIPEEWLSKTEYILENYDKLIKDYDIDFSSDESLLELIYHCT